LPSLLSGSGLFQAKEGELQQVACLSAIQPAAEAEEGNWVGQPEKCLLSGGQFG